MNLKYYQKIINLNLRSFFDKLELPKLRNPLIKEQLRLLRNFCLSPGKRLRPILAIAVFKAISSKPEKDIFLPVLSLELYHNYTLIHDDIYDEDVVRRGNPAYHFSLQGWFKKKYKNIPYFGNLYKNSYSRFGVVSGFIGGKILRSLVNLPIFQSNISFRKKIEILKLFEKLDIVDNFGQATDLFFEKEKKITEKDYFLMVNLKTGGLFKTSVELGAILADATPSQRKVLKNYAENLAYVFQIKDDLLDLSIGGEKGRGTGSDIREGKKTLLLISALKRANKSQMKKILKIVGNEKAKKEEIKEIIKIYYKVGVVDLCEKIARKKIKKAIYWLKKIQPKLKNSEYQSFLENLAYFMLERKK
jgi:geranylgeranyl diphosphate synthase type I